MTPDQLKLTRRFGFFVALINLGMGITGLCFGPSHFKGHAYEPATKFLHWLPGHPSTWWTALLVAIAIAELIALATRLNLAMRITFAFGSIFWVWWTVSFALAYEHPGAGPWAPWLAAMCALGNARPVAASKL